MTPCGIQEQAPLSVGTADGCLTCAIARIEELGKLFRRPGLQVPPAALEGGLPIYLHTGSRAH